MIELKNITKQFHQKNRTITALSEVNLHVPKGKIFGVIGASGAGKSTLIRIVNLLERPSSGTISVDGVDLLSLSPGQLAKERRQIGMIFQHFNLLSSKTVFQNIAFPLELDHMPKDQIGKRVQELLALVGLEDKANDYPSNLSGGQKQRVAIARTLASNPKVLLSDEATSALDPATTESILNLLKDINKRLNITILLITHEMEVIKTICDEVAVISEGKLIEQGTVSEIFAHPKTEITRAFIASSLKVNIPQHYLDRLKPDAAEDKKPLLKLQFTGQSSEEAVISEASRLFNVNNNILFAQIGYAGEVKFGSMVIEVSATAADNQLAIAYYQSKNVAVEVLGYV